jgi:hypothetical protein
MYLSSKSSPNEFDVSLLTFAALYTLVLEAPQNLNDSNESCLYQICISWNINNSTPEIQKLAHGLSDQASRLNLIRSIAQQWAEPFRSFLMLMPDTTEIKQLDLSDFVPRIELRSNGNVLLVGDAFHAMAMCKCFLPIRATLQTINPRLKFTHRSDRGEGANHTIVDILELSDKVLPHLYAPHSVLRTAIDGFEESLVLRTRSAVLASRKACLDAHDWHGLTADSPLLTKRQMQLEFPG